MLTLSSQDSRRDGSGKGGSPPVKHVGCYTKTAHKATIPYAAGRQATKQQVNSGSVGPRNMITWAILDLHILFDAVWWRPNTPSSIWFSHEPLYRPNHLSPYPRAARSWWIHCPIHVGAMLVSATSNSRFLSCGTESWTVYLGSIPGLIGMTSLAILILTS